ncbi:hypothetical protein ACFPME_08600 [Rhodanobacter umsongensis]|uniref:FHA domain-containing protein n=1 Tax=Rhodanobacter umsongensis TaxID=633153 RepID=A0ABW0JKW5_9GAMM
MTCSIELGNGTDATVMPERDAHHSHFELKITRLTQHVICCRGSAQNHFSVTDRSRECGNYPPAFKDNGDAVRASGSRFLASGNTVILDSPCS